MYARYEVLRFVNNQDKELQRWAQLCRQISKQTRISMLHASFLYSFIEWKNNRFEQQGWRQKLGHISWAFRYPVTWWRELWNVDEI